MRTVYGLRNLHATISTLCLHRHMSLKNGVYLILIFKITCTPVFTCIFKIAKRDNKLDHVMSCLLATNISAPTQWTVNFLYLGIF